MAGVGSFLDSSKASSQNYLLQGLAMAVALHIALLSIQLRFTDDDNDSLSPLNVSIQLEKPNIENEPPALKDREPQDKPPKQPETIDFYPQTIVVQTMDDDPKPEPKPRIQISTSGESFMRFLQSETDRNTKSKEKVLGEFSATFEPDFEVAETPPETSYSDFQGALGGGLYNVFKNGKVICVLKGVPLSFDDHIYGAGNTSRDCTPQKKFDLNLRKNTRE